MSLLFIVVFLSTSALGSVVIDCTFPCKVTTEACVVTTLSIKCAPVSNNQWILRSRNSIPVFQGTLAAISQNCQSVPFPVLKNATTSDFNSTETIIEWPPVNTRNPYDKYLGNCESNAFCNDQLVCTQRNPQGRYCESTHQCVQGSLCTEYTCQTATTNFYNTESSGVNTIHIIAAIVGVVLAIVVLLAIYLFRRRRNRTAKSTEEDQKPQDSSEQSLSSSLPSPTSSLSSSCTNQHQQISTILPYECHFENNTTTTTTTTNNNNNNNGSSPSQQQQELQYQLQRQVYHDHKEIVAPPPPYTP
ncbi:hypothetical protein K501DRAFT_256120 [Backusella circina FSU 941]|nr:hypothetical protein K501DRAFT_256120 [Backusella circina FSU 941]